MSKNHFDIFTKIQTQPPISIAKPNRLEYNTKTLGYQYKSLTSQVKTLGIVP